MSNFSSPLLFERYELKYLIPEFMVDEISQYVEIFCELDPYSEREADNYYKVNNLYLDSPNFLFLERRLAGIDHRFNLRLRSYGDQPLFPYFCEIKHKTMGIVKKHRAKIFEDNWVQIFKNRETKALDNEVISETTNYKKSFIRLLESHNAEPKVFTQYRRKAYASVVDEYARVTFDKELRYEKREVFDLTPTDEALNYYDNPLKFYDSRNIILELKCTTKVPKWFMDLIAQFGLQRVSFSKYVSGIEEVFNDRMLRNSPRVVSL